MATRRIVYMSWPANEITGGIKLAYRHVEVLREAGMSAVIGTPDGKGPPWFSTMAPTVSFAELPHSDDILVFPENDSRMLLAFQEFSNLKAVFCQNQFMVFRGLGGASCYSKFGVSLILAEGRYVVDFCEQRFPRLRIYSVPVVVDSSIFRLGERKKLQIAYAPRKRPMEAEFIRDLFCARNPQHAGLKWIPLVNLTEDKMAEALAESAIYLALSRFESFSLSILEAFAAGCITAGFTGTGARIFTTSDNGFWAEEDDCIGCVHQLERAVKMITQQRASIGEMINAGLSTVRRYDRKAFHERIVHVWKEILSTEGAG